MKNNLYCKKNQLIRDIFDIIMTEGYNETKEDAISIYTKDKFVNQVYVRKLDINKEFKCDYSDSIFIDSVAITSDSYNFDGCCDADIRVAFQDRKIGKRVVCWINELYFYTLRPLHDYILSTYITDLDTKYYNILIEARNNTNRGNEVTIPRSELDYVLRRFKEEVLDKK
jgi:hypothetical protein